MKKTILAGLFLASFFVGSAFAVPVNSVEFYAEDTESTVINKLEVAENFEMDYVHFSGNLNRYSNSNCRWKNDRFFRYLCKPPLEDPNGHVAMYIKGTIVTEQEVTEYITTYETVENCRWKNDRFFSYLCQTPTVEEYITVQTVRTPVTITVTNDWDIAQCWSLDSGRVYCDAGASNFIVSGPQYSNKKLTTFRFDMYDSDADGKADKVNLAGGYSAGNDTAFRVTGLALERFNFR